MVRRLAGAGLLERLEMALKNHALAQASRERLLGLFLIVSGAIIAIDYTITGSPEESGSMLLRILAHHLVLIGERVGLFVNDLTKTSVTKGCNVLWDKMGYFEWNYNKVAEDRDSETESPIHKGLSPGLKIGRPIYEDQYRHDSSIISHLAERPTNGFGWNDQAFWHNESMNISALTSQAAPILGTNQPPMLGLNNSRIVAAPSYCFLCDKSLSIDGLCHTCLESCLPTETVDVPSLGPLALPSAPIFAQPDIPYAAPVNTSVKQPIDYWQTQEPQCRISGALGSDFELFATGGPVFQQEEAPKGKDSESETYFLRPRQLIRRARPSESYVSTRQHTVTRGLPKQGVEPTMSPTTTSPKRERAPSPKKPYAEAKVPQKQRKSDKTRSLSKHPVETSTKSAAAISKRKRATSPNKLYKEAKLLHKQPTIDTYDSQLGLKDQRPSVTGKTQEVLGVLCCNCSAQRLPGHPYKASFPRTVVESGGWICDDCPMSSYFGPNPPRGRFCYCYSRRCTYRSTKALV
ncbi:MAG: hypothetical protein OHK93_003852 [Ramalina farinacea]|uniref:Uncharacterized protein n=1 Tax=Ramalina farinacea TaxID=258253 RepID=A0AA43QJ56_9LECA|nr:hypothetical protein [Ramalina farinacea]